jgi:4'-phosphopantetheinyl transferase
MHPTEPLALPPDEVHLWHATLRDWDVAQIERWRSLLSEDEGQRLERLAFDRLKHEYLLTRALCRITLSRYWPSTGPAAWRFQRNAWGRPRAMVAPHGLLLDFNLAHSHGVVVMAVASPPRQVGVDVELVERDCAAWDIARRCFSQAERSGLESLPLARRVERFFELWSAKEAYIKARGFGLSMPLDAFTVDIESGTGEGATAAWLASVPPDDDPQLWALTLFDFPPRHKLALCCRRSYRTESVAVRWFPFAPALRSCNLL